MPSASNSYWRGYLGPELNTSCFPSGGVVVDVGCGWGEQLDQLRSADLRAIGLELDPVSARGCRARGHLVIRAKAEELPIRSGSSPGVLCKVVLPYTDERLALAEISRILSPGGVALLYLHGLGYFVRLLVWPAEWRHVVYGVRTIVNTFFYRIFARRLPGFLGDTIYQSDGRMARYYQQSGLTLEGRLPFRKFMGLPVFMGHLLRK